MSEDYFERKNEASSRGLKSGGMLALQRERIDRESLPPRGIDCISSYPALAAHSVFPSALASPPSF